MESLINETKESLESINVDLDIHKKARQETIDRVIEAKFIVSLLEELKSPKKESTWDETKELDDSHNYAIKFVEKATEEAKTKIQNTKNKVFKNIYYIYYRLFGKCINMQTVKFIIRILKQEKHVGKNQ